MIIIRKTILLIAIVMLLMSIGCVYLPSPDASPSQVVDIFASSNGIYYLMSTEYKKTVNENDFENKKNKCEPNWIRYEYVGIINGSEHIEGNNASVEINYLEKFDDGVLGDYDPLSKMTQKTKTKTIYLINETSGWRLKGFSCELRTK